MSLLDTIKGAREEAEANSLRTKKTENADATDGSQSTTSASAGFSRRSAARAKPAREAAKSVRVGDKPASEMTKEEKKAARAAKRKDEDLMLDAKRVVLEEREDYRRTQRIWWGMVIVGLVFSVISFFWVRYMQNSGNATNVGAGVSMALMVLAYVLIIGAFIYDIVKVRPLRKEADDKILGMSKRKLQQVVDEGEERKAAKK